MTRTTLRNIVAAFAVANAAIATAPAHADPEPVLSTNQVSALPVPLPHPASTMRGSMLVLRTTQPVVGGPVVPGAQPIEIPRPTPGSMPIPPPQAMQSVVGGPVVPGAQPIEIPRPTPGSIPIPPPRTMQPSMMQPLGTGGVSATPIEIPGGVQPRQ